MFKKILIANRGEIALRIIRAAKELNIKTVAVYSKADEDSLHVRFADESVCIGPASAQESYLNIPRVVAACEITGADAVHPGYGFLAENAKFAEICEEHLVKFIGPSLEAIKRMGHKAEALKIAKKAGVPIIPGCDEITSDRQAQKAADRIGYPVIIKAAAGGGGKGMRIVREEKDLISSLLLARREAEAAFSNPHIYLEKYITKPRHVEVQILADNFGNMIHLGERDCSIQFRHQKLLEESPSGAVDAKFRKKMGEMALKVAKQARYTNVGTVEFLLDENGNFYFIEMNTRIQVEHPVTEAVTGTDLIKEQIRLAAGKKLNYHQKDIPFWGHAIECRINAVDPFNGFAPSSGKIAHFYMPGGPGVRIDSHVYTGYEVSSFYDPLIAKVIVHAPGRDEAILRMERTLEECVVENIATTIPLHLKIMRDEDFKQNRIDTHFLEEKEW